MAFFYSLSLGLHLFLLGFILAKEKPVKFFNSDPPSTGILHTQLVFYPNHPKQPSPRPIKNPTAIQKNSASKSRQAPAKTLNVPSHPQLAKPAPTTTAVNFDLTTSPDELLRLLYFAIAKTQRYPESSLHKNLRVRVAFSVQANGTITNIVLDKSSHYPEFDRAALQSVADASPVLPMVGKLQQPKTFRIEIIFAKS